MATIPAVCPVCGRVCQLDAERLLPTLGCACGAKLRPVRHGAAVMLMQERQMSDELPEVQALLAKAAAESKPSQKYALYQQALALAPQSFATRLALLHHGRWHECERDPGNADLIKCHLLNLFDHPDVYPEAQREAMRQELFEDPLLLELSVESGHADRFTESYLRRLAQEYIGLFIRGRSDVSQAAFGLPRPVAAVAASAARIVARQQQRVAQDLRLTPRQHELLTEALEHGFLAEFPGEDEALNQALAQAAQANQPEPRRRWFG